MSNWYTDKPASNWKEYFRNLFVSIDQLLNALTGGNPDETITSRCGKRIDSNSFCRWWCKQLDKIDERHCHKWREDDEPS